MQRELIITKDGSTSFFVPELNENYHSSNGSITEAQHVFLKHGIHYYLSRSPKSKLSVLEIGFGTGLNTWLTWLEAEKMNLFISYVGVEAYPITNQEVAMLNYAKILNHEDKNAKFEKLHAMSWNEKHRLDSSFELLKVNHFFEDIDFVNQFDIVYFDAFGFDVQPELWSVSIFKKMFDSLKYGGLLTTYACRSVIKKNLQEVGFTTQKLPGAPGKREMLVGLKI